MIASLQIETARKQTSFLKHAYYTPPFKVANITEDTSAEKLELMLMNASPGILDGDEYKLELKIGAGSSLHLHTQSYQRLFTMKGSAQQLMNVWLEENASFIFLPHPAVPHKNSVFTGENNIFLTNGCELLWGEILTCGRKGCGEVFSFSKYHNRTTIYYNGKLVIKENLLVRPAITKMEKMGQWEGFTHQASLIYWNETINIHSFISLLRELLKEQPDIAAGISSLPANGLLVRVLGNKAEKLHELFKEIALFISHQKLLHAIAKTGHLPVKTSVQATSLT